MPIYEYKCTSCHHHFDILQKVNDAAVSQCPNCMEHTATRLISAAGFQLKGSGWYATDFKNKDKPSPKKEKDTPSKEKAPTQMTTEKKTVETTASASKKGDA